MNIVNQLYISVAMIIMLGIAYYLASEKELFGETQVYSGLYAAGLEYSMFVSCAKLPIKHPRYGDGYATDITFRDKNKGFDGYERFFEKEYLPVFIKVRGQLMPWPNDWMNLSHTINIYEVMDVKKEKDKECDPPFSPRLREITVEYDTESPEKVFERLKDESIQ